LEDIVPKYNSHTIINLYIDSSDIHNDGGVELTATGKIKRKKLQKFLIFVMKEKPFMMYYFIKEMLLM